MEKVQMKCFNSPIWLVTWSLRNDQNHCVHDIIALQPMGLEPSMLEEAQCWGRVSHGWSYMDACVFLGISSNFDTKNEYVYGL